MKKLFAATLVLAAVMYAASARAEAPQTTTTQFCQNGSVVAACPDGVQSNLSSVAYSSSATDYSVVNRTNNYNSVAPGQQNAQSVARPLNNSDSVAYASHSTNDSVAYSSNSAATNGSVAYSGGASGGASQSVVH